MLRTPALVATAAATAVVLLLTACGPKPGSPEWVVKDQKERREAKADDVDKTVDELPDWFVKPPVDAISLYGPATASAGDVQLALDKAVLTAKRVIAEQLRASISSKMRTYLGEMGHADDPTLTTEVERVTSSVVTEVQLVGVERKETRILPRGTQYRVYVLMRYPLEEANRIMIAEAKKNAAVAGRLRASQAFQDLEREIRDARDRKAAAEKTDKTETPDKTDKTDKTE
ncbi:MAG: LPP20 family lipoprotein [Alphaproteobacteria bacterium]